jgi:poly(3-hydroxybutyrate) depolymerase
MTVAMRAFALAIALLAAPLAPPSPPAAPSQQAPAAPPDTVAALRAAAEAAIVKAKARAITGTAVINEITMPSIERLVVDADARAAKVTVPERDAKFVRNNLETARAFAERVAAGEDPYRSATGMVIKAYRADWDGTLQPYALYVPREYKPGRPGGWPLIVALHGAFSDHRHNLRRVFGLDNRRGENDAEASRNELPLPDLQALVVSPFGRGELMGYDGLGGDDVMHVLADVARAYDVDAARISITGLSMGGGGAWQLGLRHPELFAAIAPVCGVTDLTRWIQPQDAGFYDIAALEAESPLALADKAVGREVFIFHGAKDTTVPVVQSRRMVERYRALGWLDKNVHYTEYPDVAHDAWTLAYKDAALLRTLAGIRRSKTALDAAVPPGRGRVIPGLFGKSVPRQQPHIYVYDSKGASEVVAAARALATALADWGPMVGARFVVKADTDVTADDRARFGVVRIAIAGAADKRPPAGDQGLRTLTTDAAGRVTLQLTARTARGFEKLKRFARPNRDAWAPEPNKPTIVVE